MNHPSKGHALGGRVACSYCGALCASDASFCESCGAPRDGVPIPPAVVLSTRPVSGASPSPTGTKDKTVAVLLAFVLGGLGVHKFYLRRTGWGVVYLLFCWTYIPFVVSLVDAALLLVMKQAEFDARYNSQG